jgi:thymidylate synthase
MGELLEAGEPIEPTKGPAHELQAVTLELTNPLARLSRSEGRGRLFSALGELCWYLSGTNATDFVTYYIPEYGDYDENGFIHGAYGPRWFNFDARNQVQYVIERLRHEPASRRAVIQVFDRHDVAEPHADVPCTCSMQFLLRASGLQMVTYMRSNDVYLGLPHDLFAFTMLQELVARSIGAPLARYVHVVGSLHLYEKHRDAARAYLGEGWQSRMAMAPMPERDPWLDVEGFLEVERELRLGQLDPLDVGELSDPFWSDLAILLGIFRLWKNKRHAVIPSLSDRLTSKVFDTHIADKLARA